MTPKLVCKYGGAVAWGKHYPAGSANGAKGYEAEAVGVVGHRKATP